MFRKFFKKIILFIVIIITFIAISSNVKAEEIKFDLNEIFENHRLVRMIIDIETGDVVKVNKAALDFYGYTEKELLNMNISQINTLSPDLIRKELDAAASERRNFFNFRHRLASGEIRNVEVHSYPIVQNGKQYLYSIIIDKTEAVSMAKNLENNRLIIAALASFIILMLTVSTIYLFKNKEKYKKMSYYDQLTKVLSRHYLDHWEDRRSLGYNNNSMFSTIVLLDIDKFKYINDKYGHITGDKILLEVANVLKKFTRDSDKIIRFGGDEFLLILENTSEEASREIMKRINNKLLSLDKFDFPLEISYGLEILKGKQGIFDVIKMADEKMYKMKDEKNVISENLSNNDIIQS